MSTFYLHWCLLGNSLTGSQRGSGGTFAKIGGRKIALPGTNLNDVSDQADGLVVICILNKIRAF